MKIKFFMVIFFLYLCTSEVHSQWELRYPDIPTDHINDICFLNEEKGFVVNDGGSVLMTTDGGNSWNIKAHYQRNYFEEIKFVDDLNGFAFSPQAYIGDDVHLIFTTDGGITWSKANVILSDALTFFPISTSMLLKAAGDGTIMQLDNFYGNWKETYRAPYFFPSDYSAPYGDIKQFQKFNNGDLLALGASWIAKEFGVISDSVSFILKSSDYGSTWDTLWCGLDIAATTFHFINDSIGWLGGERNHIYKTTNGGLDWFAVFSDTLIENNITSITAINSLEVFAVNETGMVYHSRDGGNSWDRTQMPEAYWEKYTIKFVNEQKGFLSGSDFWNTKDGGNSWERVSKSIRDRIWKIDFINNILGWAAGDKGIYRTSDGGYNWDLQYSSNSGYVHCLDMLDSLNGWATSTKVLKTTDGGKIWNSFSLDNSISLIRGVHFLNHDVGIIYEVWDTMVDSTINYVTTDGGNTWKRYPIHNMQYVTSYNKVQFTDSQHLWFINQQGIWLSKDTGKTWILNDSIKSQFSVFDFFNSQIFWLQEEHESIMFTNDGGNFWERKDTPYDLQGIDMKIIGRDYFGRLDTYLCGWYGALINFSEESEYGTYINKSFTQNNLESISEYVSGNYADIWIAGDGFTILHRRDFVTDVITHSNNLITEYSLFQNYPNPFNPKTIIRYRIPETGLVTLKVFDVLGREVATVVNEEKQSGSYEVEFDGSNLSSGVYFYRMQATPLDGQAGDFIETKKMVLLK